MKKIQMRKLSILLFALLCTGAMYGQNNKKVVAVLMPKVIQGTFAEGDQLFIATNMKNAFSRIIGYQAFPGQSQAMVNAETEFRQSGKVSREHIKKIGEQTEAIYICLLSLSLEGSKLVVNSDIIDVVSGETINSDVILFAKTDKNNVMKQCQSLANRLLRGNQPNEAPPSYDEPKNNQIVENQPAPNNQPLPKHTEKGVVILGVRWATRNVASAGTFTANPEEVGMYYQWNRSKGWETTGNVTGWNSTQPSGNSWSTTNRVCPSGYRLPTDAELKLLIASGSKWTTQNGVKGRVFGSGSNSIFLPAGGYRSHKSGTLNDVGLNGHYWSSTQDVSEYAYFLYFGSGNEYRGNDYRGYGYPVRCVGE